MKQLIAATTSVCLNRTEQKREMPEKEWKEEKEP